MNNIMSIVKKELKSYLISPIAYIVISLFLVFAGFFFFFSFFMEDQSSMRRFFTLLPVLFAFTIPALTMRLFSEELNIGSFELIQTLPVSTNTIILGKFLGSVFFIAIMLVPTFSYAVFISFIGDLDWGSVIGGYFGAILMGAAFSAVGMFASSMTRNQIIALFAGIAICLGLTIVIDLALYILPDFLVNFVQYLGANYHFRNISKGIIDSRDIIYFASVCFVMLYSTRLAIQERK